MTGVRGSANKTPRQSLSLSRRLLLITTGGTIAMTETNPGDGGDLSAGGGPALTGNLHPDTLVETAAAFHKPSASISLTDIRAILALLHEREFDGAVIAHGTDTIEETAFALQLLYRGRRPVVLTGAMRRSDQTGYDGGVNVADAARVALSSEAVGKGVMVVFDQEIHSARWVRKVRVSRVGAFSSCPFGPLGWIAEGEARFVMSPNSAQSVLPTGDADPVVALLEVGMGFDTQVLEAAASVADGLVLSLPGAGHLPQSAVAALEQIAARIPVLFASRTGAEGALSRTYSFAGSERDLLAKGALPARHLDARKARVLLLCLLAGGADRSQVGRALDAA